ncbi:type III restriction-modification system endonuclease [Lysinibacillus capsici]|uniref:type III restriction-modification system endonuclease n=1 Tax=Lysinibacillus capsici TaxID=2115968 RepID=UPI002FDCDC97
MAIELQELDYQVEAIQSVVNVFNDIPMNRLKSYQNPIIGYEEEYTKNKIRANITSIQSKNNIDASLRSFVNDGVIGIDVKMETGTGKTYVYSRLMLELNKEYGFNKFIIVVPSTPIKEGTNAFIKSDMFKRHYRLYPDFSNHEINLQTLNRQSSNGKKGRKYIPREINEFVEGDSYSTNTIHVLLTGMAMLQKGKTSTLDRNDYDQTLLSGTTRPVEAIADTRPIVIIDEPHRFDRNNKTYKYILENIKPQAIIRFGATFPINSDKTRDYNNLVFNLSSADAFNRDLVKGVSVYNPEIDSRNTTRFRLVSISNKKPKTAKFMNMDTYKEYIIASDMELNILDESFATLSITNIGNQEALNGAQGILLSNDKAIRTGDSIYSGVFSTSYQELMINQALDLHFEKEKENFFRANRYKTLALFFIDSPDSFRGVNGRNGKLREYFEEVLENKLKREIEKLKSKNRNVIEEEYLEYLNASLNDISETNGGYFSRDNDTSDEAIQEQVRKILRDKESLLSFKNESGEWNTLRFIFSKWTLREGWDNPNIFTIAKLRSSGSENNKIQEVGRGLRLPVDEFGNRAIAGQETFYLNYLIDHTENDFASQLVNEINEGVLFISNIDGKLEEVALQLGKEPKQLFIELLTKNFVDMDKNIVIENREQFYEEYPLFNTGLKNNKVTKGAPETVKIRKENFEKIREIWLDVNQNYMVDIEGIDDEILTEGIQKSLSQEIFSRAISNFSKRSTKNEDGKVGLSEARIGSFEVHEAKLSYGEFLKMVSNRSSIPVQLLHKEIVTFHERTNTEIYTTKKSVDIFISNFEDWFIKKFASKYTYRKVFDEVRETQLTNIDGSPKNSVSQALLGVYKADINKEVPKQFLFDKIIYDSNIEEKNIINGAIDSVEVFSKIPRRSIQVPMYFGGTTSPDFLYVIKSTTGEQTLNLIIESKDIEKKSDSRGTEDAKIEASIKFFKTLKENGVNVEYNRQMKNDDILRILNDLK